MGLISYTWEGLGEAQARIGRLASLGGLEGELEAEADAILPALKAYPPERAGQKYTRSYRFRDSWNKGQARRTGGGVELDLTNPTPYGPLLVGDNQARMHVDRWWKLRKVAEDRQGELRGRVQRWAIRTWRGG